MRCAWKEFMDVLPFWMREKVDSIGSGSLQELRIRSGLPPELILRDQNVSLDRQASREDIRFVVNAASKYSPWAAATSAQGYITSPGGHRIGICGEAVMEHQTMRGIRSPTSLCIRIARDFPGISEGIPLSDRSILIIGKPGSGKTTLLRDLIRRYGQSCNGSVGVVDERGELFPVFNEVPCFARGKNTDILHNCPKKVGIINLLRTMSPSCIAVDEITHEEDCEALLQAGWSGVSLIATAHASSKNDLLSRPVYASLIGKRLFDDLVILQSDKSWKTERMPYAN